MCTAERERGNCIWTVTATAKRGADVDVREKEFNEVKGKTNLASNVLLWTSATFMALTERVLGLRRVLVWKPTADESGSLTGRKAKARLIIFFALVGIHPSCQ